MSVATVDEMPVRLPVFPATRAGCSAVPRPCPFERCRYHLAPERTRGRSPATDDSCALDVADRGGLTLDEVGHAFGVTRERIRQIEAPALAHLAAGLRRRGLITKEAAARLPQAMRPGPGRPRGG